MPATVAKFSISRSSSSATTPKRSSMNTIRSTNIIESRMPPSIRLASAEGGSTPNRSRRKARSACSTSVLLMIASWPASRRRLASSPDRTSRAKQPDRPCRWRSRAAGPSRASAPAACIWAPGRRGARARRRATVAAAAPGDIGAADRVAAEAFRLERHDHALADLRHAEQRRLDLAELDPMAARLDLRILAAEEVDQTVPIAHAEIAGAVDPAAGLRGQGHERRAGALLIAPVAERHAGAADADLADLARRQGAQVGSQDVQRLAVAGAPDRHAWHPGREGGASTLNQLLAIVVSVGP